MQELKDGDTKGACDYLEILKKQIPTITWYRFGLQAYLPETICLVPELRADILENELELGETKSFVPRYPTSQLFEKGPYCSMYFVATEACEAMYKGNT